MSKYDKMIEENQRKSKEKIELALQAIQDMLANKERISELIRMVGLDPAMKKKVGQYSLGMRQRLGIAQALLDDPALLILDEPMNGLDKNGVKDIRSLLLDLKAQGKTILLASHFAQDIDELCDTVHEMDQGIITMAK